MAIYEYDHANQCYEVLDDQYRYLATVTPTETSHMFGVQTQDVTDFNVFVSDVRSTIDIIETTSKHKFFGGSVVKLNDKEAFILSFDEGKITKSTFYRGVYRWVHEEGK